MSSINRTLEEIKKKYGRETARAFAAAIDDVRSNVVLRRVIQAIERGDIDTAIDALNIDETLFTKVRAAMVAAYNDGAIAVVAATRFSPPTATRAVVRWDASNPVAEKLIRETVGAEITKITQSTLAGVREALANGYSKGQGPRNIALDVVGRVGANGKRTGGLVGLSEPQVRLSSKIDDILSDPSRYREYFKRDSKTGKLKPRWKGTNGNVSRAILKAMNDGKQLTAAQIEKIQSANKNKMLKQRGTAIARTETAGAVEQSRIDAFKVGMAKGGYPDQYVIKEWLHGGGGMKPRVQHVHESGQSVRGLDTPFTMSDNTQMQRPHDPAAPAKHVINCTCTLLLRVDWKRMRVDGVI